MHQKINDITGKKKRNGATGCMKSKDGTILMDREEIVDRIHWGSIL